MCKEFSSGRDFPSEGIFPYQGFPLMKATTYVRSLCDDLRQNKVDFQNKYNK